MLETRQTIINNIHAHISNQGGIYKDWRIGVCTNAETACLEQQPTPQTMLYQQAASPEDATAIMAYFVYIYDVVRDKRDIAFENCDIVYIYKAANPLG